MFKFEMENMTSEWCKEDLGVKQDSHSLLFYLTCQSSRVIKCVHGVQYSVVGKDGIVEWKSEAEFRCAADVCLTESRGENMKGMMEQVNKCVIEYGLKVNFFVEKKIY